MIESDNELLIIELETKFGYDSRHVHLNRKGVSTVFDRESNNNAVCFSGIFLHNRVAVFQEKIY